MTAAKAHQRRTERGETHASLPVLPDERLARPVLRRMVFEISAAMKYAAARKDGETVVKCCAARSLVGGSVGSPVGSQAGSLVGSQARTATKHGDGLAIIASKLMDWRTRLLGIDHRLQRLFR